MLKHKKQALLLPKHHITNQQLLLILVSSDYLQFLNEGSSYFVKKLSERIV